MRGPSLAHLSIEGSAVKHSNNEATLAESILQNSVKGEPNRSIELLATYGPSHYSRASAGLSSPVHDTLAVNCHDF